MVFTANSGSYGFHVDVNQAAICNYNAWLSGLDMTKVTSQMKIDISSGSILYQDEDIITSADTLTFDAAHATLTRRDLIVWNGSTFEILKGADADDSTSIAKPVNYDIESKLVIGMIKVRPTVTEFDPSDIYDYRIPAIKSGTAANNLIRLDSAAKIPALDGSQITNLVPVGGIIAWNKTFNSVDAGTTTSTTSNKLIDSSQNFLTTVSIGNIVKNTTDNTFSYVTAVDSDVSLSLNDDIMLSSKSYIIYATPKLDNGWIECNGQVLSDAGSSYNGATMPDMNTTPRFLRGNTSSGSTGGEDTHVLTISEMPSHRHSISMTGSPYYSGSGSVPASNYTNISNTGYTNYTGSGDAHQNMPSYYEVVWIMRVK